MISGLPRGRSEAEMRSWLWRDLLALGWRRADVNHIEVSRECADAMRILDRIEKLKARRRGMEAAAFSRVQQGGEFHKPAFGNRAAGVQL